MAAPLGDGSEPPICPVWRVWWFWLVLLAPILTTVLVVVVVQLAWPR